MEIEGRFYSEITIGEFTSEPQAQHHLARYKKIHPDWTNIRLVFIDKTYYLIGSSFGYAKYGQSTKRGQEGEQILIEERAFPDVKNWSELELAIKNKI